MIDPRRELRNAAEVTFLAMALGCSGGGGSGGSTAEESSKADSGASVSDSGAAADDTELPLECPARGATLANSDTYVEGLEKIGKQGVLTIKLLDAQPTPPARGNNTWKIQVRDEEGVPVGGARFDWTDSPWMPCHQHGSSVAPDVSAADADGIYTIAPLYFIMPGIWRTTFSVASNDGKQDSILFQFYVEQ